MIINAEIQTKLSEILDQLGKTLDITETQYNAITASYEAVGGWLSAQESILAPFKPVIIAQGSFMLGTMIPPSNGTDELDIDLVCRLTGKRPEWTQYDLKQIVGRRLKDNRTYSQMVGEEGRRCWTLHYADTAKYHMDILPSLVDGEYDTILEKALSGTDRTRAEGLSIRITDREEMNYRRATEPNQWPKSNPFGFGIWFYNLARTDLLKAYSLREAIRPVPAFQLEKFPLQRVVQILKWHRNQLFQGDPEKPISIIITTLAAKAYEKQTDLLVALDDIVKRLPSMIEQRYDSKRGRLVDWVPNPVNDEENFADKWSENRNLRRKFVGWVEKLQADLQLIYGQVGNGYDKIQEAMEEPFGKKVVETTFKSLGNSSRIVRESGGMKMAAVTGMLGSVGRTGIGRHTNFGADE